MTEGVSNEVLEKALANMAADGLYSADKGFIPREEAINIAKGVAVSLKK